MRKLAIADIADARAYERERSVLRDQVIELKRRRRVAVGTIVSVMFENRETMRYQIQEMARVERIFTDEALQQELDAYNPMIPEPGQLCATVFIELTSDDQMREWLPRLVGIENSLVVRLPQGDSVRGVVAADHAAQLTRDHITAAVHYVTFQFTPEQVAAFGDGTALAIDHPKYQESAELAAETVSELRSDLNP